MRNEKPSAQMVLAHVHIHLEKKSFDTNLVTNTQLILKWIIVLKVKTETIKLLKKKQQKNMKETYFEERQDVRH